MLDLIRATNQLGNFSGMLVNDGINSWKYIWAYARAEKNSIN